MVHLLDKHDFKLNPKIELLNPTIESLNPKNESLNPRLNK
jgi:hypothetical protein